MPISLPKSALEVLDVALVDPDFGHDSRLLKRVDGLPDDELTEDIPHDASG